MSSKLWEGRWEVLRLNLTQAALMKCHLLHCLTPQLCQGQKFKWDLRAAECWGRFTPKKSSTFSACLCFHWENIWTQIQQTQTVRGIVGNVSYGPKNVILCKHTRCQSLFSQQLSHSVSITIACMEFYECKLLISGRETEVSGSQTESCSSV